MRKQRNCFFAFAILVLVIFGEAGMQGRAQEKPGAYPAMAPKDQYLMADRNAEIAMARSAGPASISRDAEVQVLGRDGFTVAVAGKNGWVCLVTRGFAAATSDPVFFNPKARGPMCVNAPAARTYLPAVLLKTRLAMAGKSKKEIAQAVKNSKQLPTLAPNAVSYMMSKQQYLNDAGKSWHPHIMVFAAGDQTKSWGADQPDSPVMAQYDPEVRMTTFFFWVGTWSDGSAAPDFMH